MKDKANVMLRELQRVLAFMRKEPLDTKINKDLRYVTLIGFLAIRT